MASTIELHPPQTLYRNWEHEQWNPWEVELTTDRDQWQHSLDETDKGLVYWVLSSLMVAEERITTKFAGLVMAAETEEEASYARSRLRSVPPTRSTDRCCPELPVHERRDTPRPLARGR